MSEPIEFMGLVDWDFIPTDWKPNQVWIKKNPNNMEEYYFCDGKWSRSLKTDTGLNNLEYDYGFFPKHMEKELERCRTELSQARERINTLEKYIVDSVLKGEK